MTTELEIEDAILVARRIVLLGRAPTHEEAELLARALLAITGSIRAAPEWVEPTDLWLDRFRVWRDKSIWVANWGPPPFDEGFRGPKRLLTDFLDQERQKESTAANTKEAATKPKGRPPKAAAAAEMPAPKRRGRPRKTPVPA